ncbi:MAG TPA: ribosome biogenesis GTPase Der [Acholeplasma sp.]|jgi:GTP-binding protein|nr:ribosome biogenesis GTPase Der [Acholeplasmatales bacterium]HHV33588.1 ribosome biogenesis GTPase Der [Acholeplasma sp.]
MSFKVAIVGRPNVGKSSLFNRIIGYRKSITAEQPGVTRDRIYARATWLTRSFGLIDTGGIDLKDAPFLEQIRHQATIAMSEADLILLVVDSRSGLTDLDENVAKMLYREKKPVIVVVNKVDNQSLKDSIYDFYGLGFGDPIGVSALHGIGIGDLLDEIIKYMPEDEVTIEDDSIKVAVIGYPNVGKSSLVNAILGEERTIISNIAGTTRDAVDTVIEKEGQKYTIIDTAGIKKRGQIYESTDYYSLLRAVDAVERSDVVLFLIDAERDLINQDKHVAGLITEYNKACVIVVNKWDVVLKETNTMKNYEDKVRGEFKFLPFAEICFVSSKEKTRLNTLFPAINKAYESYNRELKTSVLNEFLADMTSMVPPKNVKTGTAKFFYMTQVSTKPPTFVIFVNDPKLVHFSYKRYLENRMRELFEFTGTPIKFIFRKRE